MDAGLPEADNPFVTRDELSNVMNALTEDFTDYNYNITGERNDYTPFMYLTHEYVLGTLKVYLNGMRLTRGIIMTTESTGNVLVMNSPLDPDDLLVVDYKIKVTPTITQ
jgi:hypothetical protein